MESFCTANDDILGSGKTLPLKFVSNAISKTLKEITYKKLFKYLKNCAYPWEHGVFLKMYVFNIYINTVQTSL